MAGAWFNLIFRLGSRASEEFELALTESLFNTLVQEHATPLFRLAYRLVGDAHEAEDVVQDTFRSAWRSRELYELGRGDRAWLVSILRRRVVDRWRRTKKVSYTSDGEVYERGVLDQDPVEQGFTDEVQRALLRLPPELRETLLLVVVGELTHQEVADQLGLPLGTVLSRVSRARNRLREYLTANVRK